MNTILCKILLISSIVCTLSRVDASLSQSSSSMLSHDDELTKQKSPGVFETIKEMENYFDKMYIIEHLRSNMHTKLEILNQIKAQLIAVSSMGLTEKEKLKFGSLVDSMTKTYKLLDIILVDFLPTEQDLLEIVEENSHLFGNHDFKAPGMSYLIEKNNGGAAEIAFNKKRFIEVATAAAAQDEHKSKRYYSWLKNSQNYNMIPVIRTGK